MRLIRSKFVQELAEDGELVWRPQTRPSKSGWNCHDLGDGTALVAYDDEVEVQRAGRDVAVHRDDEELSGPEAAELMPDNSEIGNVRFNKGKARDKRTNTDLPVKPKLPRAAVVRG